MSTTESAADPEQHNPSLIKSYLTRRGYRARKARRLNILNHNGVEKSGLTPVTPGESSYKNELLKFQRQNFQASTAGQLKVQEAMAAFNYMGEPKPLVRAIHPFYAKDNWEHSNYAPYNLPTYENGPDNGPWHAHNPSVWAVLEPCLILASKFIFDLHLWPWWGALCNGRYVRVDNPSDPNFGNIHFYPRDPEYRDRDTSDAQSIFAFMREDTERPVTLKLGLGFIKARDGTPWGRNNTDPTTKDFENIDLKLASTAAVTSSDPLRNSVEIMLDYRFLMPLLQKDILIAERLVRQFYVAVIILHETAHACFAYLRIVNLHKDNLPQPFRSMFHEPHYQDEPIDELGASLEKATFGSILKSISLIPSDEFDKPIMGLITKSWPAWNCYRGGFRPLPNPLPKSMLRSVSYPIPMIYFQQIWDEDFWNAVVSTKGSFAVRYGPLTDGYMLQLVNGKISSAAFQNPAHILAVDDGLPPAKKELLNYANQRVYAAIRIQENLKGTGRRGLQRPEPLPDLDLDFVEIEDRDDDEAFDNRVHDPDPKRPVRYDRMRQWFIDHRDDLYFEEQLGRAITGHALLAHCNRVDRSTPRIKFQTSEFRQFMMYCYKQRDLFEYHPLATGLVRYIENGWPKRPNGKRPVLPVPDGKVFEQQWKKLRIFMVALRPVFKDRYPDYDTRVVRAAYNRFEEGGGRWIVTAKDWDQMMKYCHYKRIYWRPGPAGIIRYRDKLANVEPDNWLAYADDAQNGWRQNTITDLPKDTENPLDDNSPQTVIVENFPPHMTAQQLADIFFTVAGPARKIVITSNNEPTRAEVTFQITRGPKHAILEMNDATHDEHVLSVYKKDTSPTYVRYRALHDREALDPLDLTLKTGAIVERVLRKDTTGMWFGIIGTNRGWFPSTSVEKCKDLGSAFGTES